MTYILLKDGKTLVNLENLTAIYKIEYSISQNFIFYQFGLSNGSESGRYEENFQSDSKARDSRFVEVTKMVINQNK